MRVGVIGTNGIGQAHLFVVASLDEMTLAAACDVNEQAANDTAKNYGVRAFTDARELYSSGEVEAVVIATPPGTHAQLTRDALDAGLHVYCEKPFTPTSDEGYELAAYARDRKRTLAVGLQFRYHKGYAAMRDALAELGELRRASLVATNWFRAQQYFRASPWRATWKVAGGGVLMSQAVHQVDALIAAAGMPVRVRGRIGDTAHDAAVEDEAIAELEWANGARGTIVASLTEPAGIERFELVGTRGTVTLADGYDVRVARHDDVAQLITEYPDEYPPEGSTVWEPLTVERSKREWIDMMFDAHREFGRAAAAGAEPAISATVGSQCVELANAIYLCACTHAEWVELPLSRGAYPPVFNKLASGRSISSL
jgi:predicted dehydrogenase